MVIVVRTVMVAVVGGGVRSDRLAAVVAVLGRTVLHVAKNQVVVVKDGLDRLERGRGPGEPDAVPSLDVVQVPLVADQGVFPVREKAVEQMEMF